MVHVGAKASDEGTSDYFQKMIPMDGLEQRMRLHRQPCSLPPKRAASSLASTCRSMVAPFPDNPLSAQFQFDEKGD